MIYETLLLFGAIGLIAQAVMGFAHGGAGARIGGARATGGHTSPGAAAHSLHTQSSAQVLRGPTGGTQVNAHGHVHANAHGHGHLHVHLNSNSLLREAGTFILGMLSPMAIFSVCLGAGATGLAAQRLHERPAVVVIAAIVGGFLLFGLIVRPLMNLLLRFASKPAETLAGAVAGEAVAASKFDAKGQGVVRLSVDGQTTRVLAHLEIGDRETASHIKTGDKLLIVSVDKKRNTCVVTPLS